ncbi:glycosyltransferase family 2 protein [Sphingobium bisphenolivorans]|uniref:glycosyltransferase family 2 protein n=1 Tax=Sphingobium bisphenolivorans TaxID=1335760 RepID=UPI0003A06A7F|nr:glycosyltransferase family 2 protein [Sphingobium bisphenolivorans]
MKVSVVTIALNAAKDLPLTIESVLAQDFEDMEYIIVDGGSWDNTYNILSRYPKLVSNIVQIEDSGVYNAMNQAIQKCNGEYIIFMNAGDYFFSQKTLSRIFSSIGSISPDVIHGDHVYVDRGLELHKKSTPFSVTRKALLEGELTHQWHDRYPCHQATLTRKSLLESLGGYDTRLEICADHDFLLRAYDKGANIKYLDETIAHYTGGGLSAQRGERCLLEFAYVYRSRSRYPHRVDEFFNISALARFDSQSQITGAKLAGFFPLEGPTPGAFENSTFSWCAGEGFSMISPLEENSHGLSLKGQNWHNNQELTLIHDGDVLGSSQVPVGSFNLSVVFTRELPPKSIVEVIPAHGKFLSDSDSRFSSMAIINFSFDINLPNIITPLLINTEYAFGISSADVLSPLLRGGWSEFEAKHLWSVGAEASILILCDDYPATLQLGLSGNPNIENDLRAVDIYINSVLCVEGYPLSVDFDKVIIKLDDKNWNTSGLNQLRFVPRACAYPSDDDPRMLGFCIKYIKLSS